MVVTSDQSWVIASSMVVGTQPQGALYLIDAKTSTPARIALTAAEGTPRCPGGFQHSSPAPHRLALRPDGAASVLYVVNTDGRAPLARFQVKAEGPKSGRATCRANICQNGRHSVGP